MVKSKFVADYQLNASKKIVYPFLSTASGLAQWFADDVVINEDKVYNFIYDGENHYAKIVMQKNLHGIRFEFIDKHNSDASSDDPTFLEFELDLNELTQSLYLRVIDYSEQDDEEEMQDIWDGLIGSLKEIIGA